MERFDSTEMSAIWFMGSAALFLLILIIAILWSSSRRKAEQKAKRPQLPKIVENMNSFSQSIGVMGFLLILLAPYTYNLSQKTNSSEAWKVATAIFCEALILLAASWLLKKRSPYILAPFALSIVMLLAVPIVNGLNLFPPMDVIFIAMPVGMGIGFFRAWRQGYFSQEKAKLAMD